MQLDLVEFFYNCATTWTINSLFLSLEFEMSCRSLNAQQNGYRLSAAAAAAARGAAEREHSCSSFFRMKLCSPS
jgi:hypothetical protein